MFEEKTINALKWMVEILERKNILYQISGGFAAKIYGSTRPVNDIDFDIPEDRFKDVEKEVEPYIIKGPKQMNDGKWDLKIITLNYHGQEIDIGGAYEAKVSNKERTKWIPIPVDFSKVHKKEVEGIIISVVSPEDLISYKQFLDGEHQVIDIEAAKNYLRDQDKNK